MQDKVRGYLDGSVPPPPVCAQLGMRMVLGAEGLPEVHYKADGRHANAMGTLHGGILCDLADVAMGTALAAQTPEGGSFTTLELKTNFLRPVWDGDLVARGRVLSMGRTTALLACDIVDDKGRLVAHATSTALLLTGDAAKGR